MKQLAVVLGLVIATAFAAQLVPDQRAAKAQNPLRQSEPVLVELFTSQGCSSCPPADRLAARLAQDPELIVISRPVTYWDRLGWKDTLAREANTELQRAYAQRGLDGYNGVYTPQMVVAGAFGEVGTKEGAIRNFAARSAGAHDAAIRVRGTSERGFAVGIAGTAPQPADVWLIGVARYEQVAIGRGENRGRQVGYTNVLIDERRIAGWRGGPASHVITPEALDMRGADRYALMVREPGNGEVLAAQWLD